MRALGHRKLDCVSGMPMPPALRVPTLSPTARETNKRPKYRELKKFRVMQSLRVSPKVKRIQEISNAGGDFFNSYLQPLTNATAERLKYWLFRFISSLDKKRVSRSFSRVRLVDVKIPPW